MQFDEDRIRAAVQELLDSANTIDDEGARIVDAFIFLCRDESGSDGLPQSDIDTLTALCELIRDEEDKPLIDEKTARRIEADIYRVIIESDSDIDLAYKINYLSFAERYAYDATVVPKEKFEENSTVYSYLTAALGLYDDMTDEDKQNILVRINMSNIYERIGLLYSNFDVPKTLSYYKQALALFKDCRDEYENDDYDEILSNKYLIVDMIYAAFFSEDIEYLGIDYTSLDTEKLMGEWSELLEEWLPLLEEQTPEDSPDWEELIIPRYEQLGEFCRENSSAEAVPKSFAAYGRAYYKRHMLYDYDGTAPEDDNEDMANNLYLAALDVMECAELSTVLGMSRQEQFTFYYAAHKDMIRSMGVLHDEIIFEPLSMCYIGLASVSSGDTARMAAAMARLITEHNRPGADNYYYLDEFIKRIKNRLADEGAYDKASVRYINSLSGHIRIWADSLFALKDYKDCISAYRLLIDECSSALEEQQNDDELKKALFGALCRFVNIAFHPRARVYLGRPVTEEARGFKKQAEKLYSELKKKRPDAALEASYTMLKEYDP